jgi:hypothetical protein
MMGGRSGFAASRATICLIIMQSLRLDAGWRLRACAGTATAVTKRRHRIAPPIHVQVLRKLPEAD